MALYSTVLLHSGREGERKGERGRERGREGERDGRGEVRREGESRSSLSNPLCTLVTNLPLH